MEILASPMGRSKTEFLGKPEEVCLDRGNLARVMELSFRKVEWLLYPLKVTQVTNSSFLRPGVAGNSRIIYIQVNLRI